MLSQPSAPSGVATLNGLGKRLRVTVAMLTSSYLSHHGPASAGGGPLISCVRPRYVTVAWPRSGQTRTRTCSVLYGSPASWPSAHVANARMGPECVQQTTRVG